MSPRAIALAVDVVLVAAVLVAMLYGAAGAVLAIVGTAIVSYVCGRWHHRIRSPR